MEPIEKPKLKIAVDFGGVLSSHDRGDPERFKPENGEHVSTVVSIPYAIEALKQLKAAGHKLYLNSFCGRNRAIETRTAIEHELPGIFDGLFFVKNKKFKGAITKYLGCDVMIDDLLDILIKIHDDAACPNPIWFKGDPTFEDKQKIPKTKKIIEMYSWKDADETISKIRPSAIADPTIDISAMIHNI